MVNHNKNECDKCGKNVGENNLIRVPFLYLDLNDKYHPDVSYLLGYSKKLGYRQYYVCKDCIKLC